MIGKVIFFSKFYCYRVIPKTQLIVFYLKGTFMNKVDSQGRRKAFTLHLNEKNLSIQSSRDSESGLDTIDLN